MHNSINHLAIIMDGNRRWANIHNKPHIFGHKKGAENTKDIIKSCIEHGIKYLTLYIFSSENWQRSEEEVSSLMGLFRSYLENKNIQELHKQAIKLKFIGNLEVLSDDINDSIIEAEKLTSENSQLNLNIAISYGARHEIINAVKMIIKSNKNPDLIDEDIISQYLYTGAIPDPDLMIRTGGQQRISNFLLWQCAYTELYFCDTLWPDFDSKQLAKAIDDFNSRERRFGGE